MWGDRVHVQTTRSSRRYGLAMTSRRSLECDTRAALARVDAAFGSPVGAEHLDDAAFEAVVDADSLQGAVHGGWRRSGMSTAGVLSGLELARGLLERDDLGIEQRRAVAQLLEALERW
jgi:hypothetical protein